MSVILLAILVGIDQLTKWWAKTYLKPRGTIEVIKNVFSFTYVENKGAAFGLFQGFRSFFLILTVIVLAVFFFLYKQEKNKWMKFLYVLVSAGAIGNAIDRLINGYVVDLFEFTFINFPVFNMADVYLVISMIIFAVFILTGKDTDTSLLTGDLDE